jgi:hypothetical protein
MRRRDQDEGHLELKFLRVICGTEAPQSADLTLRVGGGQQATAPGRRPGGRGLQRGQGAVPQRGVLQLYQVSAVTEGMDAQATVSVRIEEDGASHRPVGRYRHGGRQRAKAYVNALNRLIVPATQTVATAHGQSGIPCARARGAMAKKAMDTTNRRSNQTWLPTMFAVWLTQKVASPSFHTAHRDCTQKRTAKPAGAHHSPRRGVPALAAEARTAMIASR